MEAINEQHQILCLSPLSDHVEVENRSIEQIVLRSLKVTNLRYNPLTFF
jgi:hypothetical protein